MDQLKIFLLSPHIFAISITKIGLNFNYLKLGFAKSCRNLPKIRNSAAEFGKLLILPNLPKTDFPIAENGHFSLPKT